MSADARRRLGAITALVAGLFIGLTLLPFPVTGPVGHWLGQKLWDSFGAGALGIPLLGIGLALAGFERLGTLDMKRSAALIIGLSLLLPYLAGVVGRVSVFEINSRGLFGQLVGAIPGFFAVEIPKGIGVAGAVLVGFLALCALTLATFAWHPLQRLERHPGPAAGPAAGMVEGRREPKRRAGPQAKAEPAEVVASGASATPGSADDGGAAAVKGSGSANGKPVKHLWYRRGIDPPRTA